MIFVYGGLLFIFIMYAYEVIQNSNLSTENKILKNDVLYFKEELKRKNQNEERLKEIIWELGEKSYGKNKSC